MRDLTFDAAFVFCGLGLGALGFLTAERTLPNLGVRARFRSRGGIDFDPMACRDFEYLTESPALCADVGALTPGDVVRFFGAVAPHALFWSPPCKGASGLLSAEKAASEKYADMNMLAVVWLRLMLAAWSTPPQLLILENVPRLKTRAPEMVAELFKLLKRAGYVVNDGFHDCGEVGGLAQHRRRYLMVARHAKRCPPVLYQPPKRRVRGCGEVLGTLPVPGTPEAAALGRMHELPRISWLNWVRLALIPAGGDWRDLDGVLAEGEARRGKFKRHSVAEWEEPVGAVTGSGSNAVGNVADPRALLIPQAGNVGMHHGKYQVHEWTDPTGTVHGATRVGSGAPSVADVRARAWFGNVLGVVPWDEPAGVVTGAASPSRGAFAVADARLAVDESDVRVERAFDAGYGVLDWQDAARTIAGQTSPGCGAYAVAEARLQCKPRAGAYGVLRWDTASKAITASFQHDNSTAAVADPRKPPDFVPIIIAKDGTWHRPMTTLELAALQGFPMQVRGKPLQLAGNSQTAWRERIGNAVPAPAAEAIAEAMLVTLAQGELGAFSLQTGSVWVEPREALHA